MRPSTEMRSHRYERLGQCLYCLAPEDLHIVKGGEPFSEEHIIPLALNGALVLPGAVCPTCQESTGRKEQVLLNSQFLVPRLLLELRRRSNKKGTPGRTLPSVHLPTGTDEVGPEFHLATLNYPKKFIAIGLARAGFLAAIDRIGDKRTIVLLPCDLQIDRSHRIDSDDVVTKMPLAIEEMGYSLAKWAYSYAVAEMGLSCCDTTAIRDLIAHRRMDVFNFVGGAEDAYPGGYLHVLKFDLRHPRYLVVVLALFASTGMQAYEVVVGTRDGSHLPDQTYAEFEG